MSVILPVILRTDFLTPQNFDFMAVNFYLDPRPDKNGDAPIIASIVIKSLRIRPTIGYNINPNKWNDKKQQVKQGSTNTKGVVYSTINKRINQIRAVFAEIENTSEDITLDDLRAIWANNFKNSNKGQQSGIPGNDGLLFHFDLFVKEQSKLNNWADTTVKRLMYMKKNITDFAGDTANYETFDHNGLLKYIEYLKTSKQLRNTTIGKNLSSIKWFLRWATNKGYSTNIDFQAFKAKLKGSNKTVIFLTWDELMTVYNFAIPDSKNYLEKVRDVFCFCCFTSLRYSDVANLKRSDIVDNKLHITTIKTSDSLQIELNKYSNTILSKYANFPYPNGKALPVISNQKMNEYIKELGELCGLDEPQTIVYYRGNQRTEEVYPKYELLSTHAGRRTFICNALALEIPAAVVMKWTGHSDYKAMKPYIDIADNIKTEQMNKFNTL